MKILAPALICALLVCGCAGGPPKDYYNPQSLELPKFNGDPTIEMVNDLDAAKAECIKDGYRVIGASIYGGDQPKAVELKAQAKRIHASKVIYHLTPPQGATWDFHVGLFTGGKSGGYGVNIVYLGK